MNRVCCPVGSLVIMFAAGCVTRLGPESIKHSHRPCNESVIETLNEQPLLNLVRLKYRDIP
jgi:hypothetical protein